MSARFNTPSTWTLSVTLLKEVTVTLHTSDGSSCRVPISPNAKRIQLLAYLAWRRGQDVSRTQILNSLFRPDLIKEKAMTKKEFEQLWRTSKVERRQLLKELAAKFDTHKKLLRRDIRTAIMQFNAEHATNPIPTDSDPFEQKHQRWGLSSLWHVTDLETIEAHTRVIEQNEFSNTVPESVKVACDALFAAYPGDFLEEMLHTYPEEFRPWATSWVREPYTHYRECYLQALWYAGEYEWQKGRAGTDGQSWEYFERAAEYFRSYAIYACNSRLDAGVSFGVKDGWPGIRIPMSEHAMCRSLAVYREQRRRQDFEACKQSYVQQMEQISHGIWKPGSELQKMMCLPW